METGILTYCGTIAPSQCDGTGHLNVQHYAAIFDSATGTLYARYGMSWRCLAEQRLGTVAARHLTTFVSEVRSGDTVECWSRIVRIGTTSITLRHTLIAIEDGRTSAQMEAVSVLFGLESRTKQPIPGELRAALSRGTNSAIDEGVSS